MEKTKKCGSRTYHRDNCSSWVRKSIINKYGDIFILCGTHAFEWSVVYEVRGVITKITYKDRKSAECGFKQITKQYS